MFLALAVLPATSSVTGGLGGWIGATLVEWLGVGAAAAPLICFAWAAILFGHFETSAGRRLTLLICGLSILAPFALAIAYQYSNDAVLAEVRRGHSWERVPWIGIVGELLAYHLRFLGVVGESLLAIGATSALTIGTVGWNPFSRLKPRGPALPAPVAEAAEEDALARQRDEIPAEHEQAIGRADDRPIARSPDRPKKSKPEKRSAPAAAAAPAPVVPRGEGEERPPLDLLDEAAEEAASFDAELDRLQSLLIETLRQFKVEAKPGGRTTGPVVTQFEVVPAAGVKVGRIAALADDIALSMKAQSIRIVAPIPGRGAVGIEVPNPKRKEVGLRKMLESQAFQRTEHELPIALGEDLEGRPIVADLAKMPHLLIAGATGSGKSVCINTIITSLVYHHSTAGLRMLMIDPKMVELALYKDVPHLRHPVVTDNKDAAKVFKWAVWEMQDRYELLHANAARNITDFNRKVASGQPLKTPKGEPYTGGHMPYIVLFVDELADLMMTVQAEIETPLAQLAQKARAIGIHVVLATQRPSVNVITGLIKANFPSRIAFRVASKVDSRTILDQNGAEALLGYGDMLFLPPGKNDPMRLQGAFISTEESERLMQWFVDRRVAALSPEKDILEVVKERAAAEGDGGEGGDGGDGGDGGEVERDSLFKQAAEVCISAQGGSTSLLQRRLKIGYGRAARLIDQLEQAGILGPSDGPRGREVLVGLEALDRI